MDDKKLIELAIQAREQAHAPYSKFCVGAALLTKSGQVFTGCNVENASYGLTICAERVAIFQAVCSGEVEFDTLAVVSSSGAAPCGACRQVMREFGPHLRVIIADLKGTQREYDLEALFPDSFGPEDLLK
jgi:cytidine deaminase